MLAALSLDDTSALLEALSLDDTSALLEALSLDDTSALLEALSLEYNSGLSETITFTEELLLISVVEDIVPFTGTPEEKITPESTPTPVRNKTAHIILITEKNPLLCIFLYGVGVFCG